MKLKEVFKKFCFVWVILCVIISHFVVKMINLGDYYEPPILIILWVFLVVYIIGYFLSMLPHNKKWDDMLKNSEPHVIKTKGRTAEENEEYLLKNGERSIAVVEDVMVISGPNLPSKRTIIKFCYKNSFGKKITKIKLYFLADSLEIFPKVGDKIEILYDKNDPNNSMISYEKPSKAPWYKLQKNYKIKIINN